MFLRLLFLGFSLGTFYALVSLGFSLVFGVTRIFNLAYGELILIGAYVAYWFVRNGLPFVAAFPVSIALLLVAGWIMTHLGFRIRQPYVLNSLLGTLGLAIILQNLYGSLFGGDYHLLNLPSLSGRIDLGLFFVSPGKFAVMVTSLTLIIVTHVFMTYTDTGLRIRATVQNREAALLSGVDVRRMSFLANFLGAALVGMAGPLFVTVHYLYPLAGIEITLLAILITILVGVGRTGAVIIGGIVLGIMESLTAYYLGGEWQEFLIALALILMLIIRPTGLLHGHGEE